MKKSDTFHSIWNMRPRVSSRLVNRQRITAATEKIGIAWRDMSSFVGPFHQQASVIADVFSVPKEIFGLEDMTDVLSYEIWEACLSDSEKNFLHKFLPEGTDANQIVQSLLRGENLHFGNSFSKWSASLFSGDLHPDSVLNYAQQLKTHKKVYYSSLQKYHNGLMNCLMKWKDIWESCKNPETLQEMWRKGIKHPGYGCPQNTSKDNMFTSIHVKRKLNENLANNINDTECIFSYKRNKREQQIVGTTKNFVDGIKMKSLSSVLGDSKGFIVKSNLTLEEEEKKKVNKHWLRLAFKDIAVATENLRKEKTLRLHWRINLGEELAKKQKTVADKKYQDNVKLSAHEQLETGTLNTYTENITTEQIEFVETRVESDLQDQQNEKLIIEESCRQTEDLQSQNADCSIPYSEYDNLEMSSVNSHDEDRDSRANMACSTFKQIDEGEPQSHPEVYLQDERKEHFISLSKCTNTEMHPKNIEFTPTVLEGVFGQALKPQSTAFQAAQLVQHSDFVEDATGVTKPPFTNSCSMEKFSSLNVVQDVGSTLTNQEKIQENPKPAPQKEPSPTQRLVEHTNFAEAAEASILAFSNVHSLEERFSHNIVQDVRCILYDPKIQEIPEFESFNAVGSRKHELNKLEPKYPMASAENSWTSISLPDSFCENQNYVDTSAVETPNCLNTLAGESQNYVNTSAAESQNYINTSAGDLLCVQQQQLSDYTTHAKDLVSALIEDGVTSIHSSTCIIDNQTPFFNPFAIEGHSVSVGQTLLLQPQKVLNVPTNQRSGLFGSSNGLLQSALFPTRFQGPRELYSRRLNGENMSYKNASNRVVSYSGPPYLIQEHQQLPTLVDGQSHDPDLFPGEHNILSSVGTSGSSQCWGNGRNVDHSMFSASPYNSISNEQPMPKGNNYNGSLPGTVASYSHQPSYFSNQELTTTNIGITNFSWANFPDQSAGMQNSLGKPYMGTSNQ